MRPPAQAGEEALAGVVRLAVLADLPEVDAAGSAQVVLAAQVVPPAQVVPLARVVPELARVHLVLQQVRLLARPAIRLPERTPEKRPARVNR